MKNWVKGVIAGAAAVVTVAGTAIVCAVKKYKSNVVNTTAEELPSGENDNEVHASEKSTEETSMEEA